MGILMSEFNNNKSNIKNNNYKMSSSQIMDTLIKGQ